MLNVLQEGGMDRNIEVRLNDSEIVRKRKIRFEALEFSKEPLSTEESLKDVLPPCWDGRIKQGWALQNC